LPSRALLPLPSTDNSVKMNSCVKAEPKERPIIFILLSTCNNGAWRHAQLDWLSPHLGYTLCGCVTLITSI